MINKKYRYGFLAVILICIGLLAVGAKYDFEITSRLYTPQNVFCIVFEAISKLPSIMFIPILGGCMMVRNKNKISTFAVGVVMLIVFCCIFCYTSASEMVRRSLIRKANPYLCGIMGGAVSAVIFFVLRKFKRSTVRKIQSMCAFSMVYFIAYIGGTGVLKVVCGRDRFDDIITGGEYAFAKWFKPDFFSSGSSFPSGHTAAAMGIMVILLLPFIFKAFENKHLPLFIAGYGYAFLTGFTRLVMGRHFLSDVAAAIFIMTVAFMVISPIYEKLYKKELLIHSKNK